MIPSPIANKYHEGRMKRTLERELYVPEVTEGESKRIYDGVASLLYVRCRIFKVTSVSSHRGDCAASHSDAFLSGFHTINDCHAFDAVAIWQCCLIGQQPGIIIDCTGRSMVLFVPS